MTIFLGYISSFSLPHATGIYYLELTSSGTTCILLYDCNNFNLGVNMRKKGHFTVFISLQMFVMLILRCAMTGESLYYCFLCRCCGDISKILTFNSIFND